MHKAYTFIVRISLYYSSHHHDLFLIRSPRKISICLKFLLLFACIGVCIHVTVVWGFIFFLLDFPFLSLCYDITDYAINSNA